MKKDLKFQVLGLLSLAIIAMSQSFADVLINDNNEADLGTEGTPFMVEPIDPQSEGHFGGHYPETSQSSFPVEIEEVSFKKQRRLNLYATLDLPVHKVFLKVAVGGGSEGGKKGGKKPSNLRNKKKWDSVYLAPSHLMNYYFSDMHDRHSDLFR